MTLVSNLVPPELGVMVFSRFPRFKILKVSHFVLLKNSCSTYRMHYDLNSLVVVKTSAYEINYYMNRDLLDITLGNDHLT